MPNNLFLDKHNLQYFELFWIGNYVNLLARPRPCERRDEHV